MSNNTGQYPAERITINNDYAEKVPRPFLRVPLAKQEERKKIKQL